MNDGMFSKGVFQGLEQTVLFRRANHRAIAQNIANVDTPGYRAKRLPVSEFQDTLKEAFQEMENRDVRVYSVPERNNVSKNPDSDLVTPFEAEGGQTGILKHDRNNVNVDREMSHLAKNLVRFQEASNLLRKQYELVSQAISQEPGR